MHLRGMLEEEFRADGIKIVWSFLRGAGPAVNELFANNLTDFASLGDLPSIVGRASGLKYRALLASSVRGNGYLAVPADSSIRDVKDLRGKKVAVNKGTATHLVGNKILEAFGLSEKDVRLISIGHEYRQGRHRDRGHRCGRGRQRLSVAARPGRRAHPVHDARCRPEVDLQQSPRTNERATAARTCRGVRQRGG
jgi:NMT1/THI5 like